MSNDYSTAETLEEQPQASAKQVIEYLKKNRNFFVENADLLAEMSLPHESGKAISLVERQVSILRDRGIEARQKLNNLLQNARNNDHLFDTTRNLVLSLLRATNVTEIVNSTQDQLSDQANVDACELILVERDDLNVAPSVRLESATTLKQKFSDVYRLKRTHCGTMGEEQIDYLFPECKKSIRSTALCPIVHDSEVMALLVLGNQAESYFNVNLDTLFLDFIGRVVGAVLHRELANSH